jgi:hypothetical protein
MKSHCHPTSKLMHGANVPAENSLPAGMDGLISKGISTRQVQVVDSEQPIGCQNLQHVGRKAKRIAPLTRRDGAIKRLRPTFADTASQIM